MYARSSKTSLSTLTMRSMAGLMVSVRIMNVTIVASESWPHNDAKSSTIQGVRRAGMRVRFLGHDLSGDSGGAGIVFSGIADGNPVHDLGWRDADGGAGDGCAFTA